MNSPGSPEEIRAALRRFRRRRIPRWSSRRAAMAVIVFSGADGPGVLLTRRVGSLGTEHGQLALPGVRVDRWESAAAAARDRLGPGLGLSLPADSVLGRLDTYVTDSKAVITPVVLWAGPAAAQRDPRSGELSVPLTDLDVEPVFLASAGSPRPMIRLPVHGEWLHAPAAAILHQFREVVLHRRVTRVAHLGQPVSATR
ncbi:MAG TPA: coenzyme A pyrophosphatase [Pseudonocardiaceae bacterium]|nr:coenzyme A pyrophosphatase [Pseudonocardiaceae bacterium]